MIKTSKLSILKELKDQTWYLLRILRMSSWPICYIYDYRDFPITLICKWFQKRLKLRKTNADMMSPPIPLDSECNVVRGLSNCLLQHSPNRFWGPFFKFQLGDFSSKFNAFVIFSHIFVDFTCAGVKSSPDLYRNCRVGRCVRVCR